MKSPQSSLEKIRAACIAANPEIKKRGLFVDIKGTPTITLADVLLALRENHYAVNSEGQFLRYKTVISPTETHTVIQFLSERWNLRQNSLEDQEPATLSFIVSLLTV